MGTRCSVCTGCRHIWIQSCPLTHGPNAVMQFSPPLSPLLLNQRDWLARRVNHSPVCCVLWMVDDARQPLAGVRLRLLIRITAFWRRTCKCSPLLLSSTWLDCLKVDEDSQREAEKETHLMLYYVVNGFFDLLLHLLELAFCTLLSSNVTWF